MPRPGRRTAHGLQLYRRLPSRRDPGVCKYVFSDGERLLEIGLYPGGRRGVVHLCFSAQWGCRMGCSFCATTALRQSFRGDLAVTPAQWRFMADTILRQPLQRAARAPLREIGFDWMGMGEPARNLPNLVHFMQIWRPPTPYTEVPVIFRVNTVGVPRAIDRLARVDVSPARLKLYLSVHAVRERARLIPYDRRAPLERVLEHARAFHARRPALPVALSYLVLPGVNDLPEDARRLVELADPEVFYLRLCSLNPVDRSPPGVRRASRDDLLRFARRLRAARRGRRGRPLRVDLFTSRGLDVELGCGQLCGRLRGGR